MQNHCLEVYPSKNADDCVCHIFFGDLNQGGELSEILPPIVITVESRFKKDFGSEQNFSEIEILSYFKHKKIPNHLYK